MAQKPKNKKNGERIIRINLSSILYIALLIFIGWMLFNNSGVPAKKVEWAQVQQMVLDGDVKDIHFVRNEYKGEITMRPDRLSKYSSLFPEGKFPKSSPQMYFLTSSRFDPETEFGALNEQLPQDDRVVIYMENRTNIWGNVFEWVFPLFILFFLYFFMVRSMSRQMGGGNGNGGGMNPFNVGKATGKLTDKDMVNVTFKDVAGLYGAKEEVMEIVDFLKNPEK